MLHMFSEVKIFTPGKCSGYGYVIWSILTLGQIEKLHKLHIVLTVATNLLLSLLFSMYLLFRKRSNNRKKDIIFFYTYLMINHGFCAWAKK